MTPDRLSLETRAVHAGEPDRKPGAPVCMPVYHSTMFVTEETGDYHGIKYLRLNNSPNHVQRGRKLAALELGDAGLVTASGMAAITASLLTVLGRGGHLLAQRALYGGTHGFIEHDFESLGLGHTWSDATRAEGWEAALLGAQNRSALEIARWLEKHRKVAKVHYPGLESHPQHARAKGLFRGFGGVLSFELEGSAAEAEAFIRRLQLPLYTVSLGGVETLVTRPAGTSHAGLSAEEREKVGISDRLIRFSVGIESTADLIADLEQALGARTA
jgi:cystathionine beta-lyase/cystathionine gamma-synthase